MANNRCSTCRCWQRLPDTDDSVSKGECHRHAPRSIIAPGPINPEEVFAVLWPPMPAEGWCDEWSPKPVAQVKEEGTRVP